MINSSIISGIVKNIVITYLEKEDKRNPLVVTVVSPVLVLVTQSRVRHLRTNMPSVFVRQGKSVGDPAVRIYHMSGDSPIIDTLNGVT